jgi:hypothetical protein
MSIKILPLPESETYENTYDAALVAVGYESRARHFFSRFRGQVVKGAALTFGDQKVFDYQRNRDFFDNLKFAFIAEDAKAVEAWVEGVFAVGGKSEDEAIKVLVDISSMTRQQIACITYFLWGQARLKSKTVCVHFVYSLAEFGTIPSSFGPIIWNGPSISQLAGWSEKPKLPCGVLLGIGYEEDLALGVIEELEAARVWAFRPKDHDPRYESAINEKNRGLFDEVPAKNFIRYSVFDPYSLFVTVETVMGLSKRSCRLIVVPFGPKIFALASCLASLCHFPEVGFWRVSGGVNQEPVDRKALGPTLCLAAVFSHKL